MRILNQNLQGQAQYFEKVPLLRNYKLSLLEIVQSIFLSEYGLRHLSAAKLQKKLKWAHRAIALIQFFPGIGPLATLIEGIVGRVLTKRLRARGSPHLFPQQPSFPSSQTASTEIPKPQTESAASTEIPKPQTESTAFKPKPTTWLFRGTQARCNGQVSCEEVGKMVDRLNTQSASGVLFNKSKILPNVIGGTCTAMSLEFLDTYFEQKKIGKESPDYNSELLLNRISSFEDRFSSSSQEMRNRQAAYNTIEVQQSMNVDFSLNKVQSLANHNGFHVGHSSKEFDLHQTKDDELSEEIERLPEGAYFIRMIEPDLSEKLEKHGHSLVYIKEEGVELFYDPNYGVRSLASKDRTDILSANFKKNLSSFGVNQFRFYQIHDKKNR